MQSRKFMSCSSPIQSEKENSSNSRVIKANTGLGVQCQNKQCLGVLVSWCWFSQWQWWWTQPLLMRRIGQRKYNYSQWEILIYSIWLTGVMKRWQNCVAQEEIWFESQTNPIEHFPKFDGNQFWSRIANSQQDEIWKAVGRNPIDGFPKFEEHSEAPPSFEVVSWHFVKEKTPGSPSKSEFRCMGELINQETPLSRTFHWVEAHWKFRSRVGGVTAAVSLFGDDLFCICFDHPNRETAMLSWGVMWKEEWDLWAGHQAVIRRSATLKLTK